MFVRPWWSIRLPQGVAGPGAPSIVVELSTRIAEIEVENFRCLRKVAFSWGPLTALIGANGTGKSSVLKALEFFFWPGTRRGRMRGWGSRAGGAGDGGVHRLRAGRAGAAASLAGRGWPAPALTGGRCGPRWPVELLVRVAAPPGARVPEGPADRRHDPCAPPTTGFAPVRASPPSPPLEARPRRRRPSTGGSRPILTCGCPCRSHLHDRRGWRLRPWRLVSFVLVPAVRDAALDAAESRTGGFRQLVELLVRTRLDVGEQLAALCEEIDAGSAEIISNDGGTILAETSSMLSERLAALTPGTAVQLRWAPQTITLDPPAVRVASMLVPAPMQVHRPRRTPSGAVVCSVRVGVAPAATGSKPAGQAVNGENVAARRLTPSRSAPWRSAASKSAPRRSASRRSAPRRSAACRQVSRSRASCRSAWRKSAPGKLVADRLARWRSALLRCSRPLAGALTIGAAAGYLMDIAVIASFQRPSGFLG
jgi:hypothetical protein